MATCVAGRWRRRRSAPPLTTRVARFGYGRLVPSDEAPLTLRTVYAAWAPLALSWMAMGLELPIVSAVMARLADPTVNLAAYGGIVLPISMIIESPIIMLLAASTALAKDTASYRLIYRAMMTAGAVLAVLHALLAFTPLFDLVIVPLLDPPPEIIEPARLGLRIMLPFTWSIAYRRFNQGLLIRFGQSVAVTIGTAFRLIALVSAMGVCLLIGNLPGIVIATCGVVTGVMVEGAYAGLRAHTIVRGRLRRAEPVIPPLNLSGFVAFYVPLALTSLLALIVQPIGSAAISRMPNALEALAVWPVVTGLLFLMRCLGFAYNEVVVALMDRPGALAPLRRFTLWIGGIAFVVTFLMAATPFAGFWFVTVSGLAPELAAIARQGLWFGILWPTLDVIRNYLQGTVVYGRRTTGVTESVGVFLVVSTAILVLGVWTQALPAVPVALIAFGVGTAAQDAWLWFRSRPVLRGLAGAAQVAADGA